MTMMWKCEICGRDRPDENISVLTYPIKDVFGAYRNLKYCNDDPGCESFARERMQKGEM